MKYAGIYPNDIVNSNDGISVSFWTQGCPFHCKGCHNPETWDYGGGETLPENYKEIVLSLLNCNGIHRNLSILGGEPLCDANYYMVFSLVKYIKEKSPDTKIYLWTGYTIEDLVKKNKNKIFDFLDILIDGPYKEDLRDISLGLRGSSNQRVFEKIDGNLVETNRV